ncbi:flavin reductase family protein [Metallosphaera tengchongensis]|uniref:Flavin reductase family protein n=1 Tax=Metallosphaera tengchongensis TaxID=1532350 RepID=A0A6N0NVN9_9CREN|nr:flavin reductase family protein [Metallosphaera tengchongensis]QKR00906.1 flavin reductase family protein [Metallosphaera tengchongensis]
MQELLKEVMRNFPLGVAVVTTNWNGKLVGMTVNTFNSLSMNPPLVLFSADRTKGNDVPFRETKNFGVNLLDKKELLDRFAYQPVDKRFNDVKFFRFQDIPLLENSYAYVVADKREVVDIGDHSLVIGEVIQAKVLREPEPIVYFKRDYWRLMKDI